MLFVEIALLLEFRIDEIALVPPFLSECPDERQLEELEEREFEFPSQLARPTADGPSVIIDSCHATYFPQAHWIEFAGEGFLDFSASVAVSTVDGAKGGSVFCLLCDLIARTLFAPTELSISSVTAVFGAPIVIFIMIRRQGKQ